MIVKESRFEEEIKKEELEKLCFEEYELRLYHNFIDGKGERYQAEEPIVTRYMVAMEKQDYMVPRPYLVNEMLDRIKGYMLSRVR